MSDDKKTDLPGADASNRRDFLTRSSVLVAALGTGAGVALPAMAEKHEDPAMAVNRVFQMALRSGGDVEGAIKEVGVDLPDDATRALMSLSREDWEIAAKLDSKLGPLEEALGNVAADNNGYIGM